MNNIEENFLFYRGRPILLLSNSCWYLNHYRDCLIKEIQKTHRVNHQKDKAEIAEINNVLSGIAEFIKKDYDDRIKNEEDKTDRLKDLESKRDQKEQEKGLESSKKTGEKIAKKSSGIIQPVQSIFDKLLNNFFYLKNYRFHLIQASSFSR